MPEAASTPLSKFLVMIFWFPSYHTYFLTPFSFPFIMCWHNVHTQLRHRFYELLSESLTQETQTLPLAEVTDEDLQYEYEVDENTGEKVVLGRGSFGTVYSAIDVVTKKKMAVKEIRETDSGWVGMAV